MRRIAMFAGLILTNVTLTASFAAARPQQRDEEAGASHASTSMSESPQLNLTGITWRKQEERLSKPEPRFESASRRFFSDQKEIWTSPRRLRWTDAEWLVPFTGITAGMILTDASFTRSLPNGPKMLHLQNDMRTGSVVALGAASGGMYLWSLHTHDPHQRETGLLAGEAMIDSLVLTEGVKIVAGRERPNQGNGQGNFFQGGDSFSSGHSAAAWAAAGILAHEYPGAMTKLLAYGLATTVSLASVGSKKHFPSDVLIGSGIGWLVSEYVYRAHHDAQVGGAAWDAIDALSHGEESGPLQNPGSTYVPLDSWVYGAFDRLAALGYVYSGFQGTRPWSRARCTHILEDVEEQLGSAGSSSASVEPQARELIVALHREFAREHVNFAGANNSAEIDSLYTRVVSARGTVLDDGYHFGQTIGFDFGRPFRQGTNLISGASASATYGSLFFYVSGEYQHAPSAPALSPSEIQFIADRDRVAPPADTPFAAINQFQLLEAYAGVNFRGWQISLGNQSLSWGPGIGGSLLLSNNAAPFPMLRISPADAVEIPGLSRLFGPFHLEQFYGRVDGHPGARQPWIYGQKISFKPFHSLEFAYGRTTLIGGEKHPLTSRLFFESVLGRVNAAEKSVPGDSRTSVEWTWQLPKMHDWATFYGELEDDDDPIPLQNPGKSVLRPGIYLPRLPLLPKWDVHFEWTTSTSPDHGPLQSHGQLNYWNLDYTSGYTNDGSLMGNTVGREGITLQAWTRYWMGPRKTLDFSWKQSRVLSDYIPGGGKWQDYQASYSHTLRSGLFVKTFVQLEHISSFPLLFPGSRNNVVASIELGIYPQWGRRQNTSSTMSVPRPGPEAAEVAR
ncbi:MAG: capsule assembly Wzi family protein [Candidatus Acidiferrales bacterium]